MEQKCLAAVSSVGILHFEHRDGENQTDDNQNQAHDPASHIVAGVDQGSHDLSGERAGNQLDCHDDAVRSLIFAAAESEGDRSRVHGGHAAGHAGNAKAPQNQHGNVAGAGGGNSALLGHQADDRQEFSDAQNQRGNRCAQFIIDNTEDEAHGDAEDSADRQPLGSLTNEQNHGAGTFQTTHLGEGLGHSAGGDNVDICDGQMGEPCNHGSHAAVDDELIDTEVDDHDPALLHGKNLTNREVDGVVYFALRSCFGSIGMQTHVLGIVAEQNAGQNGDDDQDNAQTVIERTIVAAQLIGDEGSHHGSSDDGEQGAAQGYNAQHTSAIADEPGCSQLEAGHLQAHAGAADNKQRHSVQSIVADAAVALQTVCSSNARASQCGQGDAGNQGFANTELDEEGAVNQGQYDTDQVAHCQGG